MGTGRSKKGTLIGVVTLIAMPAAWAGHDESRVTRGVRTIAHEVEEAAAHLNEAARAGRHHDSWGEYRALRGLEALEQEARHFHRQVERYGRDPAHTEADFVELLRAHEGAVRSFRWLHAYGHVRRDFDRLAYLMDRLIGAYGIQRERYGPYRGHGYYDDDRHGRRWRDD